MTSQSPFATAAWKRNHNSPEVRCFLSIELAMAGRRGLSFDQLAALWEADENQYRQTAGGDAWDRTSPYQATLNTMILEGTIFVTGDQGSNKHNTVTNHPENPRAYPLRSVIEAVPVIEAYLTGPHTLGNSFQVVDLHNALIAQGYPLDYTVVHRALWEHLEPKGVVTTYPGMRWTTDPAILQAAV